MSVSGHTQQNISRGVTLELREPLESLRLTPSAGPEKLLIYPRLDVLGVWFTRRTIAIRIKLLIVFSEGYS